VRYLVDKKQTFARLSNCRCCTGHRLHPKSTRSSLQQCS